MPIHELPDPLPLHYHEPGNFEAWISGWAQYGGFEDWSAGGWLVGPVSLPRPPIELWWHDARVSRHEAQPGKKKATSEQRGFVSAASRVLESLHPRSTVVFYCASRNVAEFLNSNAAQARAKLASGADLANDDWWRRVLRPIEEKGLTVTAQRQEPKGPCFKIVKQTIDGRVAEARAAFAEG